MAASTHQELEGLAAEYASAITCREQLTLALRRRLQEIADEMAPALREAIGAERGCKAALLEAVTGAPELFAKPRTRTLHGIKYGWQTGKASIRIADEARTIELIRRLVVPEQHPALIVTKASVYKPGVLDLEEKTQRKLGIVQVPGQDAPLVKPITDAVDKLVDVLLAETEAAA